MKEALESEFLQSVRRPEMEILATTRMVFPFEYSSVNDDSEKLRLRRLIYQEAMQFQSLITFTFRESTANAKSVLSVLGACVKSGDEIEFHCDGPDEKEALETMVKAVEDGLGE